MGHEPALDPYPTSIDQPEERLRGRIFPGPPELLDAVIGDVFGYTGSGNKDDMAMLAIGRPPPKAGPDRRGTMPVVR